MASYNVSLFGLFAIVSMLNFCLTLSMEMRNSVEEHTTSPSQANQLTVKPKPGYIMLANRFGTVQKNHPSEECINGTWQEVAEEMICVTTSPPRMKRKPGRRPG